MPINKRTADPRELIISILAHLTGSLESLIFSCQICLEEVDVWAEGQQKEHAARQVKVRFKKEIEQLLNWSSVELGFEGKDDLDAAIDKHVQDGFFSETIMYGTPKFNFDDLDKFYNEIAGFKNTIISLVINHPEFFPEQERFIGMRKKNGFRESKSK